MKVLDLQCEEGHTFEGWFSDEQAYTQQQTDGLLQCPVCASQVVRKLLSAPRLNLGAAPPKIPAVDTTSSSPPALASAAAGWLAQAREWVAQADDVGAQFTVQARAMHEGELPPRAIRGVASAAEAQELRSEGIGVLPLPAVLVEPLH